MLTDPGLFADTMAGAMGGLPTLSEGGVDIYLERLQSYFTVHKTKPEAKIHLLVMGLSEKQYSLVRDHATPAKPTDLAYEQLVRILTQHFKGTHNRMTERAKFREVKRAADESVSDFVARLKGAARTCEFGANLSENLVEQFRIGINDNSIRDKLIDLPPERRENMEAIITAAQEVELNNKLSDLSVKDQGAVQMVRRKFKRRAQHQPAKPQPSVGNCFRCMKSGHVASDKNCPARGKRCRKCKKLGHFEGAKFCKGDTKHVHNVHQDLSTEEEDNTLYAVKQQKGQVIKTPSCSAVVAGETIPFLINTGACENIISMNAYERLKQRVKLLPTNKQLYGYGTRCKLDLLGLFRATISVQDNSVDAEFYVFNGSAKCLLSFDTACGLGLLSVNCNVTSEILPDNTADIVNLYPEVFQGVGKLKDVKLKLHVDREVAPVAQPVRRLPFGFRGKVKAKLQELLDNDIVEPVAGVGTTWVSPLVCILQDSGEIRQTVDMRLANKAIVRERHPIPTTKEMLTGLQGAKVFSKLDLKQGFHQIELDEGSRDVTTFITPFGLFRYKRLSMGLNCAPEQFQYVIQTALSGLAGVQNLADDIILHAKDRAEHDIRLRALLARLQEVGLTLNPRKCAFRLNSIKFLGYVVSEDGVSPDRQKVESILNFSKPENVSDCRSFLGLVNFVGQFIPDLATTAEPIRRVTHKDQKFVWGPEQQQAFDKVKACMANAETLAHFDPDAKTVVIADASPYALGCILVQNQGGIDRVVAYGHRSLSQVERRYSQTEREALSLVFACEHFQMYLLGNVFELVTDHKPLETTFNRADSKPSPRLERWALRLQCFRYRVVYRSGKSNIADPLSRMCPDTIQTKQPSRAMQVTEGHINTVARAAVPTAMTWEEIRNVSAKCSEVNHVLQALETNNMMKCSSAYQSVSSELANCQGVLLRGDRIVIPVELRKQAVELAHEGHQGIVKTKQRLRTKVWWPGMDAECEKLCRACVDCMKVSIPEPLAKL